MTKCLFLAALLFCFFHISAQPGDPGGDPDVPISGVEILLGVGGALGIKRILQKRRIKGS
jgi:hypothetical protein